GTVQHVIRLEGGRSALRLTVGSYHRPSGQEIHKWKGAKETDDWGVRPNAGLEALVTNRENDLIFGARRKRDFVSWADLLAAGENEPTSTSTESDAAGSARTDPATIDPQLRKALEHLQQKINATELPGRV